MNTEKLYEQRLTRFDDVLSRRIPDRVPIIPNMNTLMYHYADISIKKAFVEEPDAIFQAAKHLDDNVPMDGLLSTSNTLPIRMAEKNWRGYLYRF